MQTRTENSSLEDLAVRVDRSGVERTSNPPRKRMVRKHGRGGNVVANKLT